MLKCTICDDNPRIVTDVQNKISQLYKDKFIFKKAFSAEDFVSGDSSVCDILLMDIDLVKSDGVNSNGIEVASRLKHNNPSLQIIFISAFHEYAQDIFTVEPVYYLQKPISTSDLKMAMDRALSVIEKAKTERFTYTVGTDLFCIPFDEILFFESDKRQMKAVTEDGLHTFYSKVNDVEINLDERFVKSHQSYIVNMDHVNSMSANTLVLDNGDIVPVSRSNCKKVRMKLTRHLGRRII